MALQTMTGIVRLRELRALCFLMLTISKVSLTTNCSHFFGGQWPRYVTEVTSGTDLSSVVNDKRSALINLNVINGTRWLNLGGHLDNFELVLGKPPATSSDMGLQDALRELNQRDVGVLLTMHPTSSSATLREHIESSQLMFPAWITVPMDEVGRDFHSLCCNMSLNLVRDKSFALDSTFARVKDEGLLLPVNLQRTQKVISDIYLDQAEEGQIRFLESQSKTIARKHPSSFTQLFLEASLQLGRTMRNGETELDDLAFLPDLQERNTFYSEGEIEEISDFIRTRMLMDSCLLLTMRAGPLLHNESIRTMQRFLAIHDNVIIIAYAKAHDLIPATRLRELSVLLNRKDDVTRRSVIFQVPLNARARKQPSVTKPVLQEGSGSGTYRPPNLICFAVLFMTLWVTYSTCKNVKK